MVLQALPDATCVDTRAQEDGGGVDCASGDDDAIGIDDGAIVEQHAGGSPVLHLHGLDAAIWPHGQIVTGECRPEVRLCRCDPASRPARHLGRFAEFVRTQRSVNGPEFVVVGGLGYQLDRVPVLLGVVPSPGSVQLVASA